LKLSGGQQQRLCLAGSWLLSQNLSCWMNQLQALILISTMKIEDTLGCLKNDYTIILVTNNTKQAAGWPNRTAFFLMGEMVEVE
jgi:phosphate transport system ATP-binding protein